MQIKGKKTCSAVNVIQSYVGQSLPYGVTPWGPKQLYFKKNTYPCLSQLKINVQEHQINARSFFT
jgi:hypothetical protein